MSSSFHNSLVTLALVLFWGAVLVAWIRSNSRRHLQAMREKASKRPLDSMPTGQKEFLQ